MALLSPSPTAAPSHDYEARGVAGRSRGGPWPFPTSCRASPHPSQARALPPLRKARPTAPPSRARPAVSRTSRILSTCPRKP